MSVDSLPIEVLAWVALVAWSLYGIVSLHHAHRVRRDDRDAERRALGVLEEGMQHRIPDHEVERAEPHRCSDDPTEHESERRRVHVRRVAA